MRIETFERVVYEHNPLAEVVCQIQFGGVEDLSEAEKETLLAAFTAASFPIFSEEVSFGFSQQILFDGASTPTVAPITLPQSRIFHYASSDGVWRVSIAGEFVALTCLKYIGWDSFLPRMLAVAHTFAAVRPNAEAKRLGLRYKDVIERERLGLVGTPWHELIEPFLLGPLAPNALAAGQILAEDEVGNFSSQTLIRLDHAMLLLQSSLLASLDGQRRAFLIDSDFFNEGDLESELLSNRHVLAARLEALHSGAGALFRRGITKRLHDALQPRS